MKIEDSTWRIIEALFESGQKQSKKAHSIRAAKPIPPANIGATVIMLESESNDIPLIP